MRMADDPGKMTDGSYRTNTPASRSHCHVTGRRWKSSPPHSKDFSAVRVVARPGPEFLVWRARPRQQSCYA